MPSSLQPASSFAFIGFGEVGSRFARDIHAVDGLARISAFDIDAAARDRAAATGFVTLGASAAEAVGTADVVVLAVTAGSVLAAAGSLSGGLAHRPLVVDVNSVSPATKQEASRRVGRAGGRYVEAAVMTSVPPHGLAAPMLLGGPHASAFIDAMAPFGMRLTPVSETIGHASSVKMCRSVMIKGLEALVTECLLTARHYGVEEPVLASLADTLPHPDWPGLARYLIGRPLQHGKRRAEEMREVARTVQGAGLVPLMSAAIAERQETSGRLGRRLDPAARDDGLGPLLDALAALAADDLGRAALAADDLGRAALAADDLGRAALAADDLGMPALAAAPDPERPALGARAPAAA
ncbi:DUF1932 domain-containing protein (plasmid) [Methylobacterium currus]|uniref:NAD(P)-dependent oxidoreductase n=1 Tax=Methylobacterium currus TaxID=2051553 RepID=UPI001E4C89FE|nr:DUF1932 domain-containing protein [Methylobacterium currus]UHC20186.1 DUF1932 domain-containing protein [Methylobacterium currus]